jgi:hypothetical protein
MNISSFSTISAIALTGLAFTFGTTEANAHGSSHGSSGHGSHGGSRGSSHGHCSTGRGHGRACSSLPRGCRPTHYRGERCWYGGGRYYRCAPTGGYICINEAPEVDYTSTYVERPVVRRRVVEQVEQPVIEEEETAEAEVDTDYDSEEVVSYLPTGCETVYVGGVRCWYRNGCYYRHCGRGYQKFHCGGRGHVSRGCRTSHVSHGCRTSHGRTCSTGRGHSSHTSHGSHSGHSSSHGGHSGGHSGHGHR